MTDLQEFECDWQLVLDHAIDAGVLTRSNNLKCNFGEASDSIKWELLKWITKISSIDTNDEIIFFDPDINLQLFKIVKYDFKMDGSIDVEFAVNGLDLSHLEKEKYTPTYSGYYWHNYKRDTPYKRVTPNRGIFRDLPETPESQTNYQAPYTNSYLPVPVSKPKPEPEPEQVEDKIKAPTELSKKERFRNVIKEFFSRRIKESEITAL